ncbi:MAG TPA: glycosyltransferase family A protein [Thermoanaerobaculia bacterium]|jgi:glycosyltransferase involved in cell wall biosynthesis|nr:glycosyltransferase family A protein [Thermoanaerobaculia bacterium]
MTSLVSVIVPIHNGERFLEAALDSVAAQTYEAIEVIVVDDGSTDKGAAIAADRGIKVVVQRQRGAGAARNAGIDVARGEILAFLDQDDLWLPTKLQRQVEILTTHPDRICLANQSYFLEPGVAPPAWFGKPVLLGVDHAGWAPSCLAVRRTVFDRIGRFDERLHHISDVDWFSRAAQLGVAIEIPPETLVHRRIHAANDSGSPGAMNEFFTILRGAAKRKREAS